MTLIMSSIAVGQKIGYNGLEVTRIADRQVKIAGRTWTLDVTYTGSKFETYHASGWNCKAANLDAIVREAVAMFGK